jgi:hypothetical protein
MRQGAQHAMLRKGVPLFLAVIAVACASPSSVVLPSAAPNASVSVSIPPLPLGNMHVADTTKTGEQASIDATDPQAMQTVLDDAGLVGVRERVYTGGRGSYSRVVVRAWEFTDAQGAGVFLDWLRTNATSSVIGEAKPVPGTELFVHEPSGCCHEETPVYLDAWQNGDVVWTVVASGPRIRTPPIVALVKQIEREV